MPNTRIAIVVSRNNNQSTRQQVWNSSTGELLWTCQEEFDDLNLERVKLLRPQFSPSGDHAAFFHGWNIIRIVDAASDMPTEVLKIDLDSVSPMKIGLFRTFAIGPQPNSLALMYLGNTSFRRIRPRVQFNGGVSIDLITVRWGSPHSREWVYYTQDGRALYCVILKFNMETGRAHRFKTITEVESVSFVRLAEWTGENIAAVVIDFQRSRGGLRMLWQYDPERKIRGYKSSGASLKFSHNSADEFQTFMSQGLLMSICKLLGSVTSLQQSLKTTRIARFAEPRFLPSNELKVVGFNNGRLTFISEREVRLVFIDTIPAEFNVCTVSSS